MADTTPKTAGLFSQLAALAHSIIDLVQTARGELSSQKELALVEEEPLPQLTLPAGEAHAEAAQLLTQHTSGWNIPRPATLPAPTYAPAMTAFGIVFIALGAVTMWPLSVVGGGIFVVAIAMWIGDLLHV